MGQYWALYDEAVFFTGVLPVYSSLNKWYCTLRKTIVNEQPLMRNGPKEKLLSMMFAQNK